MKKAILKYIQHWKKNLSYAEKKEYKKMGLGFRSCPLCRKYYFGEVYNCENCPICLKTKEIFCCKTPYEEVCRYLDLKDHDKLILAIKSEIEFLKGLL